MIEAIRAPAVDRLDLPPGFTAVGLRELGDAFAHAQVIAAEAGAGTLVWVRRFDTIEFALVVEPDEPLASARRVLYAAMNALGDALAAAAPPEKPVTFDWPATVCVDGGILGGARLAWPAGASEESPADWLVVGILLRTLVPHVQVTTKDGHVLDERLVRGTSLASAGFESLDNATLVASFARHFLVHADQWQAKGFTAEAHDYLGRLPRQKGLVRGIDANGDLLVRQLTDMRTVTRHALLAALAASAWQDPASGEPWL